MIPQKPQKHFNDERNIESGAAAAHKPDRISLVLSFVHCVLKGTDPQGHWPLSTQQRHWPSDLWHDRKSKNLQIIKDTGNRSESRSKNSSSAVVPRLTAGSLKCVLWCGAACQMKAQMKAFLSARCLCLQINPTEVEALLSRLPCTFRQELTGVGASLEKRWNFCGFQGIKST